MTKEDRIFDNCMIIPAYCVVDNKMIHDSLKPYPYGSKDVMTRSPSATDYYNAFCQLSKTTQEIICFTSSRKIISSYENAVIAAKACRSARIEVIDSGATAGSMHMLIKLCRALEGIGVGFTDIIRILNQQKHSIITTFTIKNIYTLKAAKRIGAISHECPMPILNQHPIFVFERDGSIVLKRNASGNINMIRDLLDAHKLHNPRRVAVYYSEATMQVRETVKAVREAFPGADVMTRVITQAIRANTGENVICIVSHSM